MGVGEERSLVEEPCRRDVGVLPKAVSLLIHGKSMTNINCAGMLVYWQRLYRC